MQDSRDLFPDGDLLVVAGAGAADPVSTTYGPEARASGWHGHGFFFCCLGDGSMDLPLALPPPNQPPVDLLVAEAAHTSRGFGFAVSHICGKAAGFVV